MLLLFQLGADVIDVAMIRQIHAINMFYSSLNCCLGFRSVPFIYLFSVPFSFPFSVSVPREETKRTAIQSRNRLRFPLLMDIA